MEGEEEGEGGEARGWNGTLLRPVLLSQLSWVISSEIEGLGRTGILWLGQLPCIPSADPSVTPCALPVYLAPSTYSYSYSYSSILLTGFLSFCFMIVTPHRFCKCRRCPIRSWTSNCWSKWIQLDFELTPLKWYRSSLYWAIPLSDPTITYEWLLKKSFHLISLISWCLMMAAAEFYQSIISIRHQVEFGLSHWFNIVMRYRS